MQSAVSPEGKWVINKVQSLANLGLLCQVPHAYESLLKHRLHGECSEVQPLLRVALGQLGTHPGDCCLERRCWGGA